MWTVDVELVADWLSELEPEDLIYTVAALEMVQEAGPHASWVIWHSDWGIDHWGMSAGRRVPFPPGIRLTFDDQVATVYSGSGDALDSVRRQPSYRKRHRELMAAKSAKGLTLSEFVDSRGIDREAVAECKSAEMVKLGRRRLMAMRADAGVDVEQMGLILDGERPDTYLVNHIESDGITCESIATLRKYVGACGSTMRVQVEVEGRWLDIA